MNKPQMNADETPRTDAIDREISTIALDFSDSVSNRVERSLNKIFEHARALERELNAVQHLRSSEKSAVEDCRAVTSAATREEKGTT